MPCARLHFIDAWRGIAAGGVVIAHLYSHSRYLPVFEQNIPAWLVYKAGLGVEIFFVLSGFVIAYSLRNTELNFKHASLFILRRQVRLDPPYWTVLLMTVAIATADEVFAEGDGIPTVERIALNAAYLQNVFKIPEIVTVAWTLCIEIQFYLVFMILLLIASSVSRRNMYFIAAIALIMSGMLSAYIHGSTGGRQNWFFPVWFHFCLGALCCWALERRVPLGVSACAIGVVALFAGYHLSERMFTGCIASTVLLVVGLKDHLHDWLTWKPLQYLGKISYSLYLVHVPIGALLTMSVCYKLLGQDLFSGIAAGALALAICIASAHLLHIMVERPSLKFANYLKGQPRPDGTANEL